MSNIITNKKFLSENTGFVLVIIGLVVIGAGSLFFLVFKSWHYSTTIDEEKFSQFGNFIGGVAGTLFALVAVILYYVALTEQRKDIKISQDALNCQVDALRQQITEFQGQKKEMELTRKLYEEQTKTLRIQQFESNFYSFLDLHIKIKNHLNETSHESYDYFDSIVNSLRISEIEQIIETNKFYEEMKAQYNAVYIYNKEKLSPYFKTIYRLMKIIDTSQLDDDKKQFYSNIVRSQITDSEMVLLYYNIHFSYYEQNAKKYFIKYDLLKHLNTFMKIDFFRYEISNIFKKADFLHFLNTISTLLTQNIKNARDIENTAPVKLSEKYEKYNVIVNIEIDIELKLELIYNVYPEFPFEENKFKDFMSHYLFDHFFYSSFIMPLGNEIHTYKTTEDNRHIMGFKVDISKIN